MDSCQKKAARKWFFTAHALQGFENADDWPPAMSRQADGRGPGLTASRNL